jgi:hypothetical protein
VVSKSAVDCNAGDCDGGIQEGGRWRSKGEALTPGLMVGELADAGELYTGEMVRVEIRLRNTKRFSSVL